MKLDTFYFESMNCKHPIDSLCPITDSFLKETHQCIDCWRHGHLEGEVFVPNSYYSTFEWLKKFTEAMMVSK